MFTDLRGGERGSKENGVESEFGMGEEVKPGEVIESKVMGEGRVWESKEKNASKCKEINSEVTDMISGKVGILPRCCVSVGTRFPEL